MGCWFGAFQFLMPLLGWALGSSVSRYIEAVDHWIAFALLALIGGRWYGNPLRKAAAGEEEAPGDLSARRLCVLAVATSIDALAVGVSMAFMPVDILSSAGIIGIVAFVPPWWADWSAGGWAACSSGGPSCGRTGAHRYRRQDPV